MTLQESSSVERDLHAVRLDRDLLERLAADEIVSTHKRA